MSKTTKIDGSLLIKQTSEPSNPQPGQLWNDNGTLKQFKDGIFKTVLGIEKKDKYQKKFLSSNVTSAGAVTDLDFSNLKIGQTYEIRCSARIDVTGTGEDLFLDFTHNGSIVLRIGTVIGSGAGPSTAFGQSNIFTATASTVTASISIYSGSPVLGGNGTDASTFATLIERNDLQEVSEF